MKRVCGDRLSDIFHKISEPAKRDILLQLRRYIDELRSIPPPKSGHIGAVDYTPLHDERVHGGAFGPFDSAAAFHRTLWDGFEGSTDHAELNRIMEVTDRRHYKCRLTHADLSFRNILIQDGNVVAFVD